MHTPEGWQRRLILLLVGGLGLPLLLVAGCTHYDTQKMVVTAYSSDPISTNWKRGTIFFWKKYVASGPNKGKPKKVGITSSGTKAKKGTIAADTHYYPYGTVMKIPGYGKGIVEDTGSAIKGPYRIDVYFSTRKRALQWGRQRLLVEIKR
jgi:3D (Asp-Asp-Asp) domain-containing protein